MEISEFIEETSKIERFFEKELDKFQRDMWYQELKNMPINRYRQVVNKSFSKCKFMPKLADIILIQEELPYAQNTNIQREKVECSKCKGNGYILYKKILQDAGRNIEYTFAARCNCQNGLEFAYDGTKIADAKHRSQYYVPLAQQLGL